MKKLIYFFLIALGLSCAQQVAPTGGPKDENPPEILGESPKSGATNFKAKEIVISFDEFAKLDKLKDQLITSPPLKYSLITSMRGKKLKIEIKDTLKENTTYVFNFGNAIVDIRENNPIENYTYVFSTGPAIDSGQVSGQLIDAFEGLPTSRVTIMAYDEKRGQLDSLPYLERPDYVAKTDEEGSFTLSFMQDANYHLFALADANDNYLFDRPNEKIAFIESSVSTEAGLDSIAFFLFEEDNEEQYVKDQIEKGPMSLLIFNLEVDSFSWSTELLDSISLNPLLEDYKTPNDSFMIWWPEMKLRFPFIVHVDTLTDTLSLAIDTIRRGKRTPFGITAFGPHNFYSDPFIKFSLPVAEIDTSKIRLWDKDSVSIPYSIERTADARNLIFRYEREEAENYVMTMDSAAVTDIYGYVNDSIGQSIRLDEASDYGSLKVKVITEQKSPLILQLLTGQKKYIKEVKMEGLEYTFPYLKSGTFSLKLIIDANGNGKWDTGEYLKALQPEKVVNYNGEIRIRSRWDKEVEWIID